MQRNAGHYTGNKSLGLWLTGVCSKKLKNETILGIMTSLRTKGFFGKISQFTTREHSKAFYLGLPPTVSSICFLS